MASAAVRCNSGLTLAYTSAVMARPAWPRVTDTTTPGTPLFSTKVAAVWRVLALRCATAAAREAPRATRT
jgi:hypothetical protein